MNKIVISGLEYYNHIKYNKLYEILLNLNRVEIHAQKY